MTRPALTALPDQKRFVQPPLRRQRFICGCIQHANILLASVRNHHELCDRPPDQGFIVGVAQHFVVETLDLTPESRFSIAFDITYVHPQPEEEYRDVVGGFMTELSANAYEPHRYVATVGLVF